MLLSTVLLKLNRVVVPLDSESLDRNPPPHPLSLYCVIKFNLLTWYLLCGPGLILLCDSFATGNKGGRVGINCFINCSCESSPACLINSTGRRRNVISGS